MLASGAIREKQNNPQYYKTLVEFPPGIPSPYENQIEMDLHRTFPTDEFFKLQSTLDSLRNILLAYSRRNISVGYCQGFNFIAGRIFKITKNEENSFWIFVQLIESLLPLSYYSELSGIIVDTSILHILLKMYHKDLYDHLVSLNYDLSLNNILYKWFVSMFIQNINEDLSYIVWDSMFLEGNIMLFFASLAMFRIMKLDIMKTNSVEELHMLFDDSIYKYQDKDIMFWYCIIKRFEFDYTFLNKHRIEYGGSVAETIIQGNKKRLEMLKKQKRQASYVKGMVLCQKDWPICIYDLDYKYNNIITYLVLRRGEKVNIIENYFFEECRKRPFRSKSFEKSKDLIKKTSGNSNENSQVTGKSKDIKDESIKNSNDVKIKSTFNIKVKNSLDLGKGESKKDLANQTQFQKNEKKLSTGPLKFSIKKKSDASSNPFEQKNTPNFEAYNDLDFNDAKTVKERSTTTGNKKNSILDKLEILYENKKIGSDPYKDLTEEEIKKSLEEYNNSLKIKKSLVKSDLKSSIEKRKPSFNDEIAKTRKSLMEDIEEVDSPRKKSRCVSNSPKKVNWRNNYDILKYKAYMNLLIERREHICEEDEDISEEQDVIKRIQMEETMRKRAVSIVHDVKNFIKGGDDKDFYVKAVSKVKESKIKDEKYILSTFKDRGILQDYEFDI